MILSKLAGSDSTVSGRRPLLIFALDSMNLELLQQWCAEGFMPNVARLRSNGVTLQLSGGGVMDEVGSWSTMFSGQPPSVHGYYSGRRLRPGGYEIEFISPQDLNYVPFWSALDADGQKSAILDAPEGKPIRGLDGIQVFNFCMHQEEYSRRPPIVSPTTLTGDIGRLMPDFEVLRFDQFERNEKYYHEQFNKNMDRLASRNRLFRHWLGGQSFSLTVIGFAETHDAAHLLWPFHQDAQNGKSVRWGNGDPVREIYRAVDHEIGEYLALYGSDCNIIIASTYGIKPQYPCSALGERLLQMLGHQVMRKPTVPWTNPISLLRTIIPEPVRRRWSAWLPLSTQMKLDNARFTDGIDFHRSRAFNLPGMFSNWVRVNLAGREPYGIVQPGKEYEDLLDSIENEFLKVIDPDSGEKAVSAVLRSCASNHDGYATSLLPDLYVHWRSSGRFVQRLFHPAGELTQVRPNFFRNSYHCLPGFALMSGPDIAVREDIRCSYLDFAPTCLSLLHQPADPLMQGRAVELAAL